MNCFLAGDSLFFSGNMQVVTATGYRDRDYEERSDAGMKFQRDNGKKRVNYQDALEFIGEVRGGISWERFCMKVVKNFEAFVDLLNDTQEAQRFLAQRSIERRYVVENLDRILEKTHFNPEDDHYLTLGLPHNATGEQIHDRWKSLMVLYHPDRNRDSDRHAVKYASKINEVYSVLKDTGKRADYDRTIMRKKPYSAGPQISRGKTGAIRKPERIQRQYAMPAGLRKVLSRVILPVWILICLFILLIIFLENKYLAF